MKWPATLIAFLAASVHGAPQDSIPDVILQAQSAYSLPASGPDITWNFVIPASLANSRYVRTMDIRPGATHAIMRARVFVDRMRSARRQEVAAGQGFPGSDPAIERPLSEPDEGRFLFWKAGETRYVEPEGFAWRLDPGNDLILSAALHPTGRAEQVKPEIALYFTDEPQEKFPMLVKVEAGDDFPLPLDADILAVYTEAGPSTRAIEAYAMLPGGERRGLIQIPDWNPNRQDVYRFSQSVFLAKGSVISVRSDAAARLWLQVLPKPDAKTVRGDRRMELEEAVLGHQLEKDPNDFAAHFKIGELRLARLNLAGALETIEEAVRLRPGEPDARNLLGQSLAALGRNTEAIEQFRAALAGRPEYQVARYNLARALVRARKYDEAAAHFEELVRQLPRDAQIRDELGELYLLQGKPERAAQMFHQALAIDPTDKVARRNRESQRTEPNEPPLLPVPAIK